MNPPRYLVYRFGPIGWGVAVRYEHGEWHSLGCFGTWKAAMDYTDRLVTHWSRVNAEPPC